MLEQFEEVLVEIEHKNCSLNCTNIHLYLLLASPYGWNELKESSCRKFSQEFCSLLSVTVSQYNFLPVIDQYH
jgi:hypothetical protein